MIVLATTVNHAISHSGSTAHVELWQVINLLGTVVLAMMFLPPVIEDLKRWRQEMADRR